LTDEKTEEAPTEAPEQPNFPPQALVGIPHNNNLQFPFVQSLLSMLTYEVGRGMDRRFNGWLTAEGCYVHRNRNLIAAQFLADTKATYLWFVDTDIQFNPNTLHRMCDKADEIDADVLACPYLLLGPEISFYAEAGAGHYVSYDQLKHDEVYDLDSAGTGLMLIHRRVLGTMKDRYLGAHLRRGQEIPAAWFAYDRVDNIMLGEDHTFCRRAKKEGFSIKGWADMECIPNHWKSQPVQLPPPPVPHPADEPEEEESRIIVP